MKNKHLFYLVLIAILIISEVFMFYNISKLEKTVSLRDSQIIWQSLKCDIMTTAFESSVENAGTLDRSIIAKDADNNEMSFEEISNKMNGNFMICRFAPNMCQECIKHTIETITKNICNFDKNKILFLDGYNATKMVKKDIEKYGLQDYFVLNSQTIKTKAEELMFPYVMAVDSNLRILSVYIPAKETSSTDYDYKHVKYMYDKLINLNSAPL